MTDKTAVVEVVEAEYVPLGTIRTAGPVAMIQQATDIATHLADIVESRKLYTVISGKKFVMVEGWTTLGAMLGVLPREVATRRLEDGGYEAIVELVRANDGAVIGRGSALCGMDEKDNKGRLTWGARAEYARRSMAITRATGKAYRLGFSWIMTLAGYEPTPAEEMTGDPESRQKYRRQTPRQQSDNGDKWKVDWGAFSTRAMTEILIASGEDPYYSHQKHVLATLRKELGNEEATFWKDGTALAMPEGYTAETLYAVLVKHAAGKEVPVE